MKLHRPLAAACIEILRQVLEQQRVLDHTVAKAFRDHRQWGKRDRHFIADSVWEVTRWRRRWAFLVGSDKIEDLLNGFWCARGFDVPGVPPAWAVDLARREGAIAEQPRAVRHSIPDWLDEMGSVECGKTWESTLEALNRRAPVFLRVNRLKADREEVLHWLRDHGVPCEPVTELPDGIVLEDPLPRAMTGDARFEIQDGGSQKIAPFAGIEPGMRVIDACAGAGGKTLHLAALMQNQGELVAMDVNGRKLDTLIARARKAGVKNLRVERWGPDTLPKWRGWADRVLIDAPCSGLGTLRRQPDLKWRLSPPQLAKVKRTQRRLLDHYPELLQAGGEFVYATCSILPSENQGALKALSERSGRWEIRAEHHVEPRASAFDGFYMARAGAAIR